MKVNFKTVREIPFEAVLSHYGIPTRRRSNTELVAQCPFPSHPADSKHEWTLAISTEIGKGYCHNTRCREASNKPKGLDPIDFVCMMDNCLPLDAAKKLAELFQGISVPPPSKPPANQPLAFALKGIDPDHPALKERGISIETAMAYGVGYFTGKGSMANRVVFPLHENSALIGYAGRWYGEPTNEHPKWLLPKGLVKSFLYGLEKCEPGKLLMLTESCWGTLWAHQNRFQGAALLGSTLTEAQERCLEPFNEICICTDNDAAGKEAAKKIADRLRGRHKVHKAYLNG